MEEKKSSPFEQGDQGDESVSRLNEITQNIAVVVGGDFGMSPRMQYHALSLAEMDDNTVVHVFGFRGSAPRPEIEAHADIRLHLLRPFPFSSKWWIPSPLFLLIKLIYLSFVWTRVFFLTCPRCSHVLVQNPPAIPIIVIAYFACRLRSMKLVIDWHNLGYTILALKFGIGHPVVRMYKLYVGCLLGDSHVPSLELFFGRRADSSLTVTKALQSHLKEEIGANSIVLYDRPPDFFHRISVEEKHALFVRLSEVLDFDVKKDSSGVHTPFTTQNVRGTNLRDDRPALVVSSTSWTPDEDFGVLFEAIKILDRRLSEVNATTSSKVWFFITGRGPLKDWHMKRIAEENFNRCRVRSVWLESRDYPLLLGSADLGISLHSSSSGLDLPMKVVDMFGAGVPVCAFRFPCVGELVREGVNGMTFEDAEELATQLFETLGRFPRESRVLTELSSNLARFPHAKWKDSWTSHARPLFWPHDVRMKDL